MMRHFGLFAKRLPAISSAAQRHALSFAENKEQQKRDPELSSCASEAREFEIKMAELMMPSPMLKMGC
jgi:hypothetical protein